MGVSKGERVVTIADIWAMKSQLRNILAKSKNVIARDSNKVFCLTGGTLVPQNAVSRLNSFLLF